jgi:hypothetical protein
MCWVRCARARIAHKLQLTPHNGLYGTCSIIFIKKTQQFKFNVYWNTCNKSKTTFWLLPEITFDLYICIEQLMSLMIRTFFACNIVMFGWSILHILNVQISYVETYLHHILQRTMVKQYSWHLTSQKNWWVRSDGRGFVFFCSQQSQSLKGIESFIARTNKTILEATT